MTLTVTATPFVRHVGRFALPLLLMAAAALPHGPAHAQTSVPSSAAATQTRAPDLPKGVRSMTVPAAELNAALSKRFPLQRTLQGLLRIELSQPLVQLQPEFNRLNTRLQLQVSEPFTNRTHAGQVQLHHRLRYEPSDRSLRLADIEVTELDFPNLPEPYRGLLRSHAPALVAQALPELPLYTAQAQDTALLDGLGFAIGRIDVTDKGLRVALQPPSAPPESGH